LKTTQQRIVFRNRPNFAQNFDFKKLFKRFENAIFISYQLSVVKFRLLTAG
jgi:hypothetical protein